VQTLHELLKLKVDELAKRQSEFYGEPAFGAGVSCGGTHMLELLMPVVEAADYHAERCEFAGHSLERMDEALTTLRDKLK
jgi:hypothetical protein